MANPKSNALFHFTRNQDSLKGILKNGFFPRFCMEDIEWVEPKIKRAAIPMSCFCDIPLSRIGDHVSFYGFYGVGLKRSWGLSNGLNPLLYVSPSSRYAGQFKSAWERMIDENAKDHFETLFKMLAFHKPIEGEMMLQGKPVSKEFYQECEWRYVPEDPESSVIFQEDFSNAAFLAKENARAQKDFCLRFSPQDVKYIFVKNDSDIPDLVNFINMEMDQYPSADLKVLITRITSLESIDSDM